MPAGPNRNNQVQKVVIRIDEVDIKKRIVHGFDKTNVLVVAAFRATPAGILQVPAQNERWVATRIGMGNWHLESRLDSADQQAWAEANLQPGDIRIEAPNIYLEGTLHGAFPGGGSISVTDGTTTVNPATKLKFASGASVSNAGGGEADVTISTAPTGPAGGDLSGTYPNPTIATGKAVKSFNGRTDVVSPQTGDYTAAQVTNAADKSSASTQTFTGDIQTPHLISTDGLEVDTLSGGGAADTLHLKDTGTGHSKHIRMDASNNLQVINDAFSAPILQLSDSGELSSITDVKPAGLTGATSASRYVGATASGAPASGTFAVGDFVIAQDGGLWVCTGAGSPGTWKETGSMGNLVSSVFGRTGAVVAASGDYSLTQIGAGTNHALAISGASTMTSLATGSAGQILRSGGASADPSWSTSTYPSTAGGIGHVPRSDGTNYVDAQLAATDLSNGTVGLGNIVLASGPAMTNPTANTQSPGDSSTKLATTAFVSAAITAAGPNIYTITQTAHGFSVGNILYYTGTAYALAQADTADHAEVVGIVASVIDANNFTLQVAGEVTGLSGLTAGTTYFLDDATAGNLTATQPSTGGHISKPLGIAVSTTTLYFYNFRGEVIQVGAGTQVTTSAWSGGSPPNPSDGDIWYATNYMNAGTRQQFQYNASGGTWDLVGSMALLYDSQAAGVTFTTSSITTPSLPQNFKNLRVEWRAVSTNASLDALYVRFNGDSAAHYYYITSYNQNGTAGTSTSGSTLANAIYAGFVTQSSGFPGGGTFDVMDYASTQYKPFTGTSHAENTAAPTWIVGTHGGQYNQSSPSISTITFLLQTGASFQSGRFMVYGVN